MRKRNVFLILLLLIILTGATVLENIYLNHGIGQLAKLAHEIEANILAENLPQAVQAAKQFRDCWEGHKPMLASLLAHEEIDNIQQELNSVLADLTASNLGQLYSASARLSYYISHLREINMLRIENIF